MLKRLNIQNYALIKSLDIEFPDGLIIITGETGAGKSILLGALSLILGKKVDSSVFNDATKNCVVEAEFENDTILRRVISPNGRSRSFLNDEPIALNELTDLSNRVIDIHAQHQHLLLSDPDFQLSILDYFSDSIDLLNRYKELYRQYEKSLNEYNKLKSSLEAADRDADYRKFQFSKLNDAKLKEGEIEELEEQQRLLSNSSEIKEGFQSVISLLSPMDIHLSQNLKEASNILSKNSKYLADLSDLSDRLSSCKIELDDIESEVGRLADQVEVSPEKLEMIESRLSLLYNLLKQHNCTSISQLIEIREALDASLLTSDNEKERLTKLEKEIDRLDNDRKRLALQLSSRRKEAALPLSLKLRESIRNLEMPKAEFKVELTEKTRLTASGGDSLSFLFSANGASNMGDISKVASGGELSRVMLALKGLMVEYTQLPTMIFDEIDTGVSGKIADTMGNMIGKMAENMQIFAITHLPQIASKNGTHFLVVKNFNESGEAYTTINRLSEQERVLELARMLSGSSLTNAAIENAKVLLEHP